MVESAKFSGKKTFFKKTPQRTANYSQHQDIEKQERMIYHNNGVECAVNFRKLRVMFF